LSIATGPPSALCDDAGLDAWPTPGGGCKYTLDGTDDSWPVV
jgi:hypothetical protein